MYYKIVSDGLIVDACDGMRFVRWQERNRMMLSCDEAGADGILTSDGSTVYLIEGGLVMDGYATATYEEITQEEYEELRAEIDAGEEIPNPDEPDPEPEEGPKTRLQALEEQVAELSQTNWMLIECLLEMSEVVYGGDME